MFPLSLDFDSNGAFEIESIHCVDSRFLCLKKSASVTQSKCSSTHSENREKEREPREGVCVEEGL